MKVWVMQQLQLDIIVPFDSMIELNNQHNEIIINQEHIKMMLQPLKHKDLQEISKCLNLNANSFF